MTLAALLSPFAPELILLGGACLLLLIGAVRGLGGPAMVSPVAFLIVAAALYVSWTRGVPAMDAAPLGLWVTSLSFYTRCIALSIGLLLILVNWRVSESSERGEFMAMGLFSLLGVLLTASANDLLLLFFAIELVSVPTYVMVALSRSDSRASEAAVKYFFLGALATALLAYGLCLLYGASGTTTLLDVTRSGGVSRLAPLDARHAGALIGLLLVFGGLAFKIAAVPFHVYAADVYEGAASPVTGLLGFVPKLAGFVALIKLFDALGWSLPSSVFWLVWIAAAATMTVGNVLALLQRNAKRMLAYSSVAHSGYMLIGLLVGPVGGEGPMRDGVAALLFYISVYGAMNLGAFALLASFRTADRDVETLEDLGGLSHRAPVSALALAVCVFSLMGFPPTAGFLGKLYIFGSAFSVGEAHPYGSALLGLAIIGVVNSAIGAAYYLKIVASAYMGAEVEPARPVGGFAMKLGAVVCAVAMVFLFVRPGDLAARTREATAVLQQSKGAPRGSVTHAAETSPLRSAARLTNDNAPSHE